MVQRVIKSRIHLLSAKEVPTLVVLQRKRAKLFHIILVDTHTRKIDHGSWFHGKLYPYRCDLSFDGRHMVYLAMGADGNTWNGLCEVPWLKTVVDAWNLGAMRGGGYFSGAYALRTNGWGKPVVRTDCPILPFEIEPFAYHMGGGSDDLGVLYERLLRDGYERLGQNFGTMTRIRGSKHYSLKCDGDDGWAYRFSPKHPELKVRFAGYLENCNKFEFWFDENPALLEFATWATWDFAGNLWVARPGVVEQYTLGDLKRGTPSFSLDVDQFEPLFKSATP